MDKGTTTEKRVVTRKIQEFYSSLPFNFHRTKEQAAQTIKNENQIEAYQDLDRVLRKAGPQAQILDIGCGSGWFVNSIAYHYEVRATGIDLCESALKRAREVSVELGVAEHTKFLCLDLFDVRALVTNFFVVNSLGVLHHTFDCREGLKRISALVQNDGYIHIGLYHRYGREPFLNLFRQHRDGLLACSSSTERAEIERDAYALYRELNKHIADELFLFSWFRDQVLNPHESQHTAEEIYTWLAELGFQCVSTSINRFEPVQDWKTIFGEEKKLFDLSYKRNCVEKKYFPGFFTVFAKRTVLIDSNAAEK
jgi:2-polyprenyl-3-methyl-5-hydroxy-6-metoxy-1,4-benzoquinol methylase